MKSTFTHLLSYSILSYLVSRLYSLFPLPRMRCVPIWLLLLTTAHTACNLNKWGLPVPEQDPTTVFTVPAIIPLHFYENGIEKFYSPGVQLAEVRNIYRQTYRHIDRQTELHTDRQTHRNRFGQTDRQTKDGQTERSSSSQHILLYRRCCTPCPSLTATCSTQHGSA